MNGSLPLRSKYRGLGCQQGSKAGRVAIVAIDQQHRRAVGYVIELGPVAWIGEDQFRPAALESSDALLDRFGAECREQRLINSSNAPGSQDYRQQFWNTWQQASHNITGTDPARGQ